MRPYLLHFCILAALMAPGIALFIGEAFFFETGDMLFSKYAATRLYWLVFMGYAIISTAIVASVHVFHRQIKRMLTKKAVILSHVLPIGFVWLLIELGTHDKIQDAWQRSADRGNVAGQQPVRDALKRRPEVPPSPPLKPSLYRVPTDNPIEQQKQTANEDHPEGTK